MVVRSHAPSGEAPPIGSDTNSTCQLNCLGVHDFVIAFPDGRSNTIRVSKIGGAAYAGLDDITVVAVPEPSTWALALLGFAGLAMVGTRRAARPQVILSSGVAIRQAVPDAA